MILLLKNKMDIINDLVDIYTSELYQRFKIIPSLQYNQINIQHIDDPTYIMGLIKKNNKWSIYNYDQPHTIIFNHPSKLQSL